MNFQSPSFSNRTIDRKPSITRLCNTNMAFETCNIILEIRCDDEPPGVEFAEVKTNGSALDSVATYTCQSGYVNTAAGRQQGVSLCTEDGWQTPHITCEPTGRVHRLTPTIIDKLEPAHMDLSTVWTPHYYDMFYSLSHFLHTSRKRTSLLKVNTNHNSHQIILIQTLTWFQTVVLLQLFLTQRLNSTKPHTRAQQRTGSLSHTCSNNVPRHLSYVQCSFVIILVILLSSLTVSTIIGMCYS